MRAITFLLTFSLVLGVTIGDPTNGLPNAGLFIFDEVPISVDAPTIVAGRQTNSTTQ